MSLKLTVESTPEGASVTSDAGETVFSYPTGASKVTLTVVDDAGGTMPGLQWRTGANSGETLTDVAGATSATYEFVPTADKAGWYTVAATPAAEVSPTGVNVQAAVAGAAPDGGEQQQPRTVAEASIGEYDAPFAGVVAVVTLVLGLVLVTRIFDTAKAMDKPAQLDAAGAAQVSATSFAWALLGVAAVVLVLGAGMAVLETRGRLRVTLPVGSERSASAAGQLESLAKVLNSAAILRGTVATLTAGVLIALAGALVAGKVGAPAPTTTSPTTSTATTTTQTAPPTTPPTTTVPSPVSSTTPGSTGG